MQYKRFTGSQDITADRSTLKGWAVNCTGAGILKIKDGTVDVIVINRANNTEYVEELSGLSFNTKISVEVVSGTWTGTIWFD